ncbi:hypothetical protein CPB84DRAFT_1692599 [Gymnopilus junonius]|uniref:Uncharacterized protein n=1 Tax=Gymnopilus junonius TaxID=109634 RepID=A0A9P5TER9_GYMJU|nr:hypothetical protein CPB84DRAFT_1692599 [Gymnopilus junonius]
MHHYPVHVFDEGLAINSDFEEPEAVSSPGPRSSSPASPISEPLQWILFQEISEHEDNEGDDPDYSSTPDKRHPALSDTEKTRLIFEFMAKHLSKFSLHKFLVTAFSSEDPMIKHAANIFLSNDCHIELMDIWWNKRGGLKPKEDETPTTEWVVQRAAEICDTEASWITDRAS